MNTDLREHLAKKLNINLDSLSEEALLNLKNNLAEFSSDEDVKKVFPTLSNSDEDHHNQNFEHHHDLKASHLSLGTDRFSQVDYSMNFEEKLGLDVHNSNVASLESKTTGGGMMPNVKIKPLSETHFNPYKLEKKKVLIHEKLDSMRKYRSFYKNMEHDHSLSNEKKEKKSTSNKKNQDTSKKIPKANETMSKKQGESNFNWSKLFISEDEYFQLKNKETDNLKNHELAGIEIYERIDHLKTEIRELKSSNNRLCEDKVNLEEKLTFLKFSKEKTETIKNGEISHLQEKNIELEVKFKKLTEQNKTLISKLEEAGPKVAHYDELMKNYNELKKDLDKAQETINTQLNLILTVKREKEEIVSKVEFSKIESENARNDKFFLSKENMTLSEKLKFAEDKVTFRN